MCGLKECFKYVVPEKVVNWTPTKGHADNMMNKRHWTSAMNTNLRSSLIFVSLVVYLSLTQAV